MSYHLKMNTKFTTLTYISSLNILNCYKVINGISDINATRFGIFRKIFSLMKLLLSDEARSGVYAFKV